MSLEIHADPDKPAFPLVNNVAQRLRSEPACITEYLDRIQRDNDAVIKRLMGAQLSLTGDSEPKLYDIAHKIRTLISDAKTMWR